MHDPKTGGFPPGVSGNPAGKPKGSRNRLPGRFFDDLYADWAKGGAKAIRELREERPHDYVRAVIAALPKNIKIKHCDDMTDDELSRRILKLAADVGITLGVAPGAASR
jgi:hypothetical protein